MLHIDTNYLAIKKKNGNGLSYILFPESPSLCFVGFFLVFFWTDVFVSQIHMFSFFKHKWVYANDLYKTASLS